MPTKAMILIADSGSTKTDWACVPEDGSRRITFTSQGYNPNYISQDEMREDIFRSLPAGFPRVKSISMARGLRNCNTISYAAHCMPYSRLPRRSS